MCQVDFSDFSGANCSHIDFPFLQNISNATDTEFNYHGNELPQSLSEISKASLICVFAYCIVFVIATTGNLIALISLWKEYRRKHSRITLLFLHMSLADLIVCCVIIPTEVVWRLTIQWRGGNILCKMTQFLRAFGLFLSSLVLICVSIDRFLAIVFPLNVIKIGSHRRTKIMLTLAWTLASLFSLPQAVFFGMETHPEFPAFKQCVTNDFLHGSQGVKVYSIFSVAAMYFVPLLVVIVTYSAIIYKLIKKSNSTRHYCNVRVSLRRERNLAHNSQEARLGQDTKNSSRSRMQLRCSGNAEANMSRARSRTLRMTVVIVVAFVFCWTPYAVMTLWYMVDWNGAAGVNPALQDGLFLMAVANSCINPMIYGSFQYKCGKMNVRVSRTV